MNATELYKAAQQFGETNADERDLHAIESKMILAFNETGNPTADYSQFKMWATQARQNFAGLSRQKLQSETPQPVKK